MLLDVVRRSERRGALLARVLGRRHQEVADHVLLVVLEMGERQVTVRAGQLDFAADHRRRPGQQLVLAVVRGAVAGWCALLPGLAVWATIRARRRRWRGQRRLRLRLGLRHVAVRRGRARLFVGTRVLLLVMLVVAVLRALVLAGVFFGHCQIGGTGLHGGLVGRQETVVTVGHRGRPAEQRHRCVLDVIVVDHVVVEHGVQVVGGGEVFLERCDRRELAHAQPT